MPDITLHDQAACVRRELRQRDRVYSRLVIAGKMTRTQADWEINAMRAVLHTLEVLIAKREPRLV